LSGFLQYMASCKNEAEKTDLIECEVGTHTMKSPERGLLVTLSEDSVALRSSF
jgi:hypothetical protein